MGWDEDASDKFSPKVASGLSWGVDMIDAGGAKKHEFERLNWARVTNPVSSDSLLLFFFSFFCFDLFPPFFPVRRRALFL